MSLSNIFLAIWMAMYAVMVLSNISVVYMNVIHGIIAACVAVALCFRR